MVLLLPGRSIAGRADIHHACQPIFAVSFSAQKYNAHISDGFRETLLPPEAFLWYDAASSAPLRLRLFIRRQMMSKALWIVNAVWGLVFPAVSAIRCRFAASCHRLTSTTYASFSSSRERCLRRHISRSYSFAIVVADADDDAARLSFAGCLAAAFLILPI